MTMTRRSVISLAIAATVAIGGCTSSVSPDNDGPSDSDDTASASMNATLGLTYIPNVQFAPAYVAHDDGAFASHDVDVTIRHHGADEGLFTSLLAGHEDMVIATGDEMLQARSQGMDLVSVGSYYSRYPVVIIVKDESGITSVADLAGKKVGLPGEYGSNYFGLLAALSDAGMSRNDIELASIGFTQVSALAGDQVDAVVGFTNNDTVQFALSSVPVREIPLVSAGEPPLIGADIVTTASFARTNPTLISAVLAGLRDGMATCVEDPDHAVEITRAYDTNLGSEESLEAARATLEATNTLFAPDGSVDLTQDLETWEKMEIFLGSIDGVLGAPVDVREAVTNDYLN